MRLLWMWCRRGLGERAPGNSQMQVLRLRSSQSARTSSLRMTLLFVSEYRRSERAGKATATATATANATATATANANATANAGILRYAQNDDALDFESDGRFELEGRGGCGVCEG